MPIVTNEQANAYALRMYNDDYWQKSYFPIVEDISRIVHPDSEYTKYEHRYLLPVVVKLHRIYVGEDDDQEYPNGIPDELATDDQGVISILFNIAIDEPFGANDSEILDSFLLSQKIKSCVNYLEDGTMGEDLYISRSATQHVMYRLSDSDMIVDTFDNNKGLLSAIQRKIKELF